MTRVILDGESDARPNRRLIHKTISYMIPYHQINSRKEAKAEAEANIPISS